MRIAKDRRNQLMKKTRHTIIRPAMTAMTVALPLLPLIIAGCNSDDIATPADPTIVQTQQGHVKGGAANGARAVSALPYPAPPTGALGWKPPAAPAAYAANPYDASHLASEC